MAIALSTQQVLHDAEYEAGLATTGVHDTKFKNCTEGDSGRPWVSRGIHKIYICEAVTRLCVQHNGIRL
jgi:hypothetical protein